MKPVVQYGVFAAYHLALETSFLADEGAFLPELPLKTPITVALPDKPSSIDRSISLVPGFPTAGEPHGSVSVQRPNTTYPVTTSIESRKMVLEASPCSFKGHNSRVEDFASMLSPISADHLLEASSGASLPSFSTLGNVSNYSPQSRTTKDKSKVFFGDCHEAISYMIDDQTVPHGSPLPVCSLDQAENCAAIPKDAQTESSCMLEKQISSSNPETSQQFADELHDYTLLKEEFALSPSDHLSILVSLSTRCVWKGTVCERSQLFRIKYYGNFDKPLGRFLRDHLFDEVFFCLSFHYGFL